MPRPETGTTLDLDPQRIRGVGFWNANDILMVGGAFFSAGPGCAWLRLTVPLVAGEDPTPAQRVAAAADFASGIGNPLDVTLAAAITDLVRHPRDSGVVRRHAASFAFPAFQRRLAAILT